MSGERRWRLEAAAGARRTLETRGRACPRVWGRRWRVWRAGPPGKQRHAALAGPPLGTAAALPRAPLTAHGARNGLGALEQRGSASDARAGAPARCCCCLGPSPSLLPCVFAAHPVTDSLPGHDGAAPCPVGAQQQHQDCCPFSCMPTLMHAASCAPILPCCQPQASGTTLSSSLHTRQQQPGFMVRCLVPCGSALPSCAAQTGWVDGLMPGAHWGGLRWPCTSLQLTPAAAAAAEHSLPPTDRACPASKLKLPC